MSKLLDQVSILRNKSPIIPQTNNPTSVGLDIVERVDLFQQHHLPGLSELSSLYPVQVDTGTHWSAKLISPVPDS